MKFRVFVSSIFLGMSIHSVSAAESYSAPSTITGVTVGPTLARAYVSDQSGGFEGCTAAAKKVAYAFDPSVPGNKFMLSVILSAKVSGQKVSFQSIDCLADYSKITHVYFCDTAGCG